MRTGFLRTIAVMLALLAPGCGKPAPMGRIVFCDAAGTVVHDIRYTLSQPPSKEMLETALEKAVPSPEGEQPVTVERVLIQAASATMDSPTRAFLRSRTLRDFAGALQVGHMRGPLLSVVADPAAVSVFFQDLSAWKSKPEQWIMRGPSNSESIWRGGLVRELDWSCRMFVAAMGTGE